MKIQIQFCTTYLCEKAFSSVTAIKTWYRSHLEINAVLRFAVTTLDPNIHNLVSRGTVGYRSLVSSKHLSSLIFRSTVFDSSGVKKGLRCSCKMHVWVSGSTKTPTAVDVRRSDVTVTLDTEVHDQIFRSVDQSDAKPPMFSSQAGVVLI
ncbi:hypothetical protein TNCV_2283871 [Trichonephila clavipes]|nr:hypothetical protein TNCV_2283871 [Trichonephila clavipes]